MNEETWQLLEQENRDALRNWELRFAERYPTYFTPNEREKIRREGDRIIQTVRKMTKGEDIV